MIHFGVEDDFHLAFLKISPSDRPMDWIDATGRPNSRAASAAVARRRAIDTSRFISLSSHGLARRGLFIPSLP